MADSAQQIETFRDFAKEKFQNHSLELDTRYQNRELASDDLKQQAYQEHQKIFEKELADKIGELLTEDNQFLRPALIELKESFVEKLKPDMSINVTRT
ncbi:MAG: hypothetical protein NVS3B8_03890 [Chitinophagaceae bacterium]